MKLDIIDLRKLVLDNKMKEVSSPNALGADGMPDPGGLYSFDIFGRIGSTERKVNFGYVELKRKFLHPFVYNMLYQMFRNLPAIIAGEKYAYVKSSGEIELSTEPDKGFETGIDFFINNWKKIKWNTNDSSAREKKESILAYLTEKEIFIDCWLIIPCWYRDINLNQKGRISVDEINGYYVKLLNLVNSESITYTNSYYTQAAAQMLLVEIHNFLSDKIKGKKGIIRQAIMGKSIDYAAISVISAPRFNSETYQDQMIPFGYIGLPLYQVCAVFFPFMVKWLEDYFYELEHNTKIQIDGYPPLDISPFILNEISTENLEKLVNSYHKDKTKMIRSLPMKLSNELPSIVALEKRLGRTATLTDLLYVAATDVVRGKHLVSSRYPITGPESIIINRIKVLTTSDTIDMRIPVEKVKAEEKEAEKDVNVSNEDDDNIDDTEEPKEESNIDKTKLSTIDILSDAASKDVKYVEAYAKYPYFPMVKGEVNHPKIEWIDTLVPNNAYLKGMGGDFDGPNCERNSCTSN